MRHVSEISGHPISTGFYGLTGCQRDPWDRGVTRLIPARIASNSVSLLDAGKSTHMACSATSQVGALSCKPT